MVNLSKKINIGKYFLITILVSYPVYSAVENWLWKIDEKEYNLDQFSQDYNAYIELMAWQMGASPEDFRQLIEKSEDIKDPRTKALIEQLKPATFADNFLLLSLLKKHASENRFFERSETKVKAEFIKDYILIQIYLNDIISNLPVEVKEEDIEKEWVDQREKNENLKSVPLDQGLLYTRQKMIQEKRESLRKEFIKSLYDRYKIEKHKDYAKKLESVQFAK